MGSSFISYINYCFLKYCVVFPIQKNKLRRMRIRYDNSGNYRKERMG